MTPTSTAPAAYIDGVKPHVREDRRVRLQLDVSSGNVLFTLVLIAFALVALSLASISAGRYLSGDPFGLLVKFNVDREGNIPTWYSASILGLSAVLLWILSKQRTSPNRFRWLALSCVMAYLSMDEAASLHELAVMPLRNRFQFTGMFLYAWVVIAIPVVVALGLYFLPLLREVSGRTAMLFFASGALYVSGGLGMELVEGLYASARGQDFAFQLLTHLEELMEMLGISVLIYATLQHLQSLQLAD